MFEICALLRSATPKVKKARKPAAKAIKVGASAIINGQSVVIAERDARFTNAWFVEVDGVRATHSFGRDMIKVV